MDDALVSQAFALECVAVALKARVSVEERRDGRLVLGRKVRVPTINSIRQQRRDGFSISDIAKINGVSRDTVYKHLAQVFPSENAERVCQALKQIFEHVGGVPTRIVFDNAAGVGRRVCGGVRTAELFGRFAAHYGFAYSFCNPNSGLCFTTLIFRLGLRWKPWTKRGPGGRHAPQPARGGWGQPLRPHPFHVERPIPVRV